MFVYEMLDPRFVLPEYAIWDPTGVIHAAEEKDGIDQEKRGVIDGGLWYTYVWKFGNGNATTPLNGYAGATDPQILMKSRICRRLLPALRGSTITKVRDWIVKLMLQKLYEGNETQGRPFDIKAAYSTDTISTFITNPPPVNAAIPVIPKNE